MSPEETTNVLTAFEMLLEEVENEIEFVNNIGARAFVSRDYSQVEAARIQALELAHFRYKTASLRQEWRNLAAAFESKVEQDVLTTTDRTNLGRLERGARTPEESCRIPILKALVQLGGSGSLRDVVTVVEKQMAGQLKEVDYEPLPSNPNLQRWRNTAQWARNSLVKEGLMKSDSRYGIWEISDTGRRYLLEN